MVAGPRRLQFTAAMACSYLLERTLARSEKERAELTSNLIDSLDATKLLS